ncbi:ribE [Symbiodinium microadriaticum]|nr:ribE [Symbiodinium microadriaticum]
MFTGIIENLGEIQSVKKEGSNVVFQLTSPIGKELKVDQSIAHDGVCLTVTKTDGNSHWVTAVDETLKRSTLKSWKPGYLVNLERCMPSNGRFDGHIVQGHVDMMARVENILEKEGSWEFLFSYGHTDEVLVDKGSVCVNGISLTCFDTVANSFRVAIIPYTFDHTNFKQLKVGDHVNLEFDIIGKYIQKIISKRQA